MQKTSSNKLFFEIWRVLKPLQVTEDAIERLRQAYCEPWRKHHGAKLILDRLEFVQKLKQSPKNTLDTDSLKKVELMIIYQSAWHKLNRSAFENMEKSVIWACQDLDGHTFKERCIWSQAVEQGLLATIEHNLDDTTPELTKEVATFLDLNMCMFAQSANLFAQNIEEMWWEWESIMTRGEFDKAQTEKAHSFLSSHPQIFFTEPFFHLEEQAVNNLRQIAYGKL